MLPTVEMSIPGQRDQAYQRLRRLLLLQKVPEGRRLRETEWSRRLEVNRGALREAFARLEAEGLIQKGPKTGYLVPQAASEDMADVLEIRIMLESGAIERICRMQLNRPGRLKPMRAACDQIEQLMRADYLLGVAEADRRFHEALIEAAGNRRLVLIYNRVSLPIFQPGVVSRQEWTAIMARVLDEHRAILAAVLQGEEDQARQLLRTHLTERSLTPLCSTG